MLSRILAFIFLVPCDAVLANSLLSKHECIDVDVDMNASTLNCASGRGCSPECEA